jgi:nuclear pore complex protein Nup210
MCSYSKPWTDRFTETSYCLFFPHSPEHLLSFMLNSKVNPESIATKERFIDISIIASVRGAPDVRSVVTASIVGGFSIPEARQVLTTIIILFLGVLETLLNIANT